jgi:hypothetical protein
MHNVAQSMTASCSSDQAALCTAGWHGFEHADRLAYAALASADCGGVVPTLDPARDRLCRPIGARGEPAPYAVSLRVPDLNLIASLTRNRSQ